MAEIKIKTPAKINLGLRIVSKRDDEYHNIETVFYPISLYDVLTFTNADNFKFTSDNEEINSSHDNLIIKAKKLLEAEIKKEIKVHIHLKKRIPIGAGLGGGSSDAAAVLNTLNKMFNLSLEEKKLQILAVRLGSDVPFFLDPQPAYASSRGEIIEFRDLVINYSILIVNPGIHISTKWAYSNVTPATPEFNLKDLTQKHLDAPEKLSGILENDFETLVTETYPEIMELKTKLLESGALFTLMTGSGSTFFSIYKNNDEAEKVEMELRKDYFTFLQKQSID